MAKNDLYKNFMNSIIKNMREKILIMFGGMSTEHEVSVITGLQVLESIDKQKYEPIAIYTDKNGSFFWLKGLIDRKNFYKARRIPIFFTNKAIIKKGLFTKKVIVSCAYLAYHGGSGEDGSIQGMLESLQIPFTSSESGSSAIMMDKVWTKRLVEDAGVPVLPDICLTKQDYIEGGNQIKKLLSLIKRSLSLPVIIKPSHLGSSIGIKVAKDDIELEQAIAEGFAMDNKLLIEKFIPNFYELNISVAIFNEELSFSFIEKPVKRDKILSFADKYSNGAKKTGSSGMAGLSRELPAKIKESIKNKILDYAKKSYNACDCSGLVRIDFLVVDEGEEEGTIYLEEINSIPGSMSYYLWEAKGISFTEQISLSIEQGKSKFKQKSGLILDYQSDILDKFIK